MAAAALVALLAVLVVMHSGASGAQPVMNRTSAVRQLRSSGGGGGGGGWQAAKATWYGAPNGAGPNDNGTYAVMSVRACLATAS